VAAELLKRGADLVRSGVHPTSVVSGYRLAAKEAVRFITESLAIPVSSLGPDTLARVAATSISSKVVGSDAAHFAALAVDAMRSVERPGAGGAPPSYPVKGVAVLKALGGSMHDSTLLRGVALNLGRAAQGMPVRVSPARVACLDMNLQKARMAMGVQVLVTDPAELEALRAREADIARDRVAAILASGANVVFTTKGVDDLCLKYLVEGGVIACRRVPRDDIKRVCRATGATLVSTLADADGGETFDAACLGGADGVEEVSVAGDDVVLVKGGAAGGGATLLLRGANDYLLDEMERAMHDALCAVKRVLESGSVVPGGGAVEAGLSVHLESFSTPLGSREQLAIAEAADALLAVPNALAVNAARDGADLVAKLRAYHARAQAGGGSPDAAALARCGLDLEAGAVRDSVAAGVLEPTMSKVNALRFAVEAAVTILRIDDIITVEAGADDGDE